MTKPITTKNEDFGFYATAQRNLDLTDAQAAEAYDAAARAVLEAMSWGRKGAAVEFLDSTYGRHLADAVPNLDELRSVVEKWAAKGWIRSNYKIRK